MITTRNSNRIILWFCLSPFDSATLFTAMNDNLYYAKTEYLDGRFQYAVKFCQYALARDPDDFQAWILMGKALMQLDDLTGTIDALENASLIEPLDKDSQLALALAYGQAGRNELSRDLLMTAATSGHVDAEILIRVAGGLDAINEPRLAMGACRQAGQIAPENAEVHYQMSYYAARCGYPTSVTEGLIRKAIALQPNNIHYRIGLASLLIRLGRKQEAVVTVSGHIPAQIEEVKCPCCLRRFANLFFDCDDIDRAKACAAQLAEMREAESEVGSPTTHEAIS